MSTATKAISGGFLLSTWESGAKGSTQKQAMLWVEAKDFINYGGWRLDTQFIDLMGSAYLLAAGTGDKVEDAYTSIEIPQGGKYRLWVRGKNWLKKYSPGRFRVGLNDKKVETTFGAAMTEEWIWEQGGEYKLPAGRLKISLHDETGHFGRCASIILTTDLSYVPPNNIDEIRKQRAKMTGINLEPVSTSEFDVIVVGAGAAGCCAAVAAARQGARTALIDRWDQLGGNAYLGVPLNGAACCHRDARESGIIEEVSRTRTFNRVSTPEAFKRVVEAESNLSVFQNQIVIEVEKKGEKIAAVKTIGREENRTRVYKGRIFIDCTGDGWVGYFGGAEYRLGREAKKEFSERLAPEKADDIMMSGVLFKEAFIYKAIDTGKVSDYVPPAWAYRFPSEEHLHRNIGNIRYGNWWIEHRGEINELWEMEKARDDLLRITFGYWDFLKNVWSGREKTRTFALQTVATTLAKRETRRLVGDYILIQQDVQDNTFFKDRVSFGGWTLDVHHPEGIFSGKAGPYYCAEGTALYSIPYRCLYSKNIENLLFAGRDMSVTHVALGTVRVQRTLGCLGQVVGIAGALCVERDIMPRKLGQENIEHLQQECLKNDLYIPQLCNEDSADLARSCEVTASSCDTSKSFAKVNCQNKGFLPLDRERGMFFPRGLYEKIEAIYLLLSTKRAEETPITLQVLEAENSREPFSGKKIARVTGTVPPDYSKTVPQDAPKHGFSHWVKFEIDKNIKAPYLAVWLPKTEGIWWGTMAKAPEKSGLAERDTTTDKWVCFNKEYHSFYTEPAIVTYGKDEAPCAGRAENVINGISRIEGQDLNMWRSDPFLPLPQWIELDFKKMVRLNTIQLTFDTNLNVNDSHLSDFRPAECVRDYTLSYHNSEKWVDLLEIKNNFQRFRVHRFNAVEAEKVRLTVTATHGDKSARVYEIRIYNEG